MRSATSWSWQTAKNLEKERRRTFNSLASAFSLLAPIRKGTSSPREPPFVSSARFWYVVRTRTFYQNRQSLLPAVQNYKSTSKSISCLLQLSGGGGVLKGILGRGQCQGLQTPTLFKTKNAHLATLFKTRLLTVLYFSVRSSRSSALRYGLPSCMSVKTT